MIPQFELCTNCHVPKPVESLCYCNRDGITIPERNRKLEEAIDGRGMMVTMIMGIANLFQKQPTFSESVAIAKQVVDTANQLGFKDLLGYTGFWDGPAWAKQKAMRPDMKKKDFVERLFLTIDEPAARRLMILAEAGHAVKKALRGAGLTYASLCNVHYDIHQNLMEQQRMEKTRRENPLLAMLEELLGVPVEVVDLR